MVVDRAATQVQEHDGILEDPKAHVVAVTVTVGLDSRRSFDLAHVTTC